MEFCGSSGCGSILGFEGGTKSVIMRLSSAGFNPQTQEGQCFFSLADFLFLSFSIFSFSLYSIFMGFFWGDGVGG